MGSSDEIDLRDLVAILKKRKNWIVVIPVIAGIIAYLASLVMTPSYSSSSSLIVGKFNDGIYTNPSASQQIILSNELLGPILQKNKLKYQSIEDFKKAIKVKVDDKARTIQVSFSYFSPQVARQVNKDIVASFIEKSQSAYDLQRKPITSLLVATQQLYNNANKNISNYNNELSALEKDSGANASTDLARTRLLDYVRTSELQMFTLSSQIRDLQMKLLNMQPAQVIDGASMPITPDSPKPLLLVTIAAVLGLMVTVMGIFFLEAMKPKDDELESSN